MLAKYRVFLVLSMAWAVSFLRAGGRKRAGEQGEGRYLSPAMPKWDTAGKFPSGRCLSEASLCVFEHRFLFWEPFYRHF